MQPERPIVGGNRPTVIGGNNNNININRPNIGVVNGGNNIGNNVGNFRPGGWGLDPGYSRPNWGNYWQSHCVGHYHQGWYHGCWHGHWNNYWYVPLAFGATAWSLSAWTNTWGYGPSYYNPYYQPAAVVAPYDYSQPVVVNNYAVNDQGEQVVPQEPSADEQAMVGMLDDARLAFKNGEYSKALAKVTVALQKNSTDPVLHEFRALCLFAQGEYKQAAAALNSLLASAPGMDWTTVSGLYGNPDDYSKQLRRLEDFARDNPRDASARFVLAYQYLVLGHTKEAIDALKQVVELEPKDTTAQRMLASLAPPEAQAPAAADPPAPAPDGSKPDGSKPDASAAPETDLVGRWLATAGESKIELTIGEDSTFTWKAIVPNQSPKELKGTLSVTGEGMSLETEKDGTMAGQVESLGPDQFRFKMQGLLPTDPGLNFERAK